MQRPDLDDFYSPRLFSPVTSHIRHHKPPDIVADQKRTVSSIVPQHLAIPIHRSPPSPYPPRRPPSPICTCPPTIARRRDHETRAQAVNVFLLYMLRPMVWLTDVRYVFAHMYPEREVRYDDDHIFCDGQGGRAQEQQQKAKSLVHSDGRGRDRTGWGQARGGCCWRRRVIG